MRNIYIYISLRFNGSLEGRGIRHLDGGGLDRKLLAAGAAPTPLQVIGVDHSALSSEKLTITAADAMDGLTSLARASFIELGSMLGSHGPSLRDVDTCGSEIEVAWRQRRLARPMRPIVCSGRFSTLKGACPQLTLVQVYAPADIDAGTMNGTSQLLAQRWP